MRILLLALPLLAGVFNAFQGGINGTLGKRIGVFEASLMNFIVGSAALVIITLLFGKGNFFAVFSVPKWQWIGGLLGATYVAVVVLMVPRIGLASVLIMIITGQLFMSAVIDNFGLFGGKVIPFDWQRGIGMVLMAVSVFLFYYKKA